MQAQSIELGFHRFQVRASSILLDAVLAQQLVLVIPLILHAQELSIDIICNV